MNETFVLIYALVAGSAGPSAQNTRFTSQKACEAAIERMEKDLAKRNVTSYHKRHIEIATATCNPL